MIVRRKYIFGKLNYKNDLHHEKVLEAVEKANEDNIIVDFRVSDEEIEFIKGKKTFDKGKLTVIINKDIKSVDEANDIINDYIIYLRDLFYRKPTLLFEIIENDSPQLIE